MRTSVSLVKVFAAVIFSSMNLLAYSQTVTTVAGGAGGYLDTTVSQVKFKSPADVAIDAAGNLFIADQANYVIRKISASGIISTFAGSGVYGFADGPAATAKFSGLSKIAIDKAGNIYVADNGNARIRKVSPAGIVSTLAGNGTKGYIDGPGVNAEFHNPSGVAVDTSGNVYVGDFFNNCIRKIKPDGTTSTLAGNGLPGYVNGQGTNAEFYAPRGVAVDKKGNVYVSDCDNNRIRKVTPDGTASLFAGNGFGGLINGSAANAEFTLPDGITVDSLGNVYVADQSNYVVRKISTTDIVSTLAGNNTNGFLDGQSAAAEFSDTHGVCTTGQGDVYVADGFNNCIRKVSLGGIVSTYAGNGLAGYTNGLIANAELYNPVALVIDTSDNLFVGDQGNFRIRKIANFNVISTLAGNGIQGDVDGNGINAEFNTLNGATIDSSGNIYIAEGNNNRIRKITPAGIVTTFAGNGVAGHVDGPVSSAEFYVPTGLAIDKQGNIYVTDQFNSCIRKINSAGIVSTLAGNIQGYKDGVGTNAEFNGPLGIAIDTANNIYVSDFGNNRIRKITQLGVVTTYAGNGISGYNDGPALSAEFNQLNGLLIDKSDNLYITDNGNVRIRKITIPIGVVSTFAGNGTLGLVDGPALNSEFNNPRAMVIDKQGNIYLADKGNNKIRKITLGSVLAVSLLNFSAQLKNSNAIINWQTASEVNTAYFNIQRSSDGVHFTTINKVIAAGNSASTKIYSYTDANVVALKQSKLYYRLQEVDKDGKSKLSNIVAIELKNANKMFIYPVPANSTLNISILQPLSQNAVITLYNLNGKVVLQQKLNANTTQQQVNTSALASGNYRLVINDNGKQITSSQVVIVH